MLKPLENLRDRFHISQGIVELLDRKIFVMVGFRRLNPTYQARCTIFGRQNRP
ncbi:MAG: hypothetical protein VKK42_04535 [Lyngbya sp.]|nr:hypothetical protein [Lyngbya sp.]